MKLRLFDRLSALYRTKSYVEEKKTKCVFVQNFKPKTNGYIKLNLKYILKSPMEQQRIEDS